MNLYRMIHISSTQLEKAAANAAYSVWWYRGGQSEAGHKGSTRIVSTRGC